MEYVCKCVYATLDSRSNKTIIHCIGELHLDRLETLQYMFKLKPVASVSERAVQEIITEMFGVRKNQMRALNNLDPLYFSTKRMSAIRFDEVDDNLCFILDGVTHVINCVFDESIKLEMKNRESLPRIVMMINKFGGMFQ